MKNTRHVLETLFLISLTTLSGCGFMFGSDSGSRVPTPTTPNTPTPFVIGSQGAANGQFKIPAGIAALGNGKFFVVDSGNSRVQAFNASGVHQSNPGAGLNIPFDVAVDSTGNIYVAEYGASKIKKISPSGSLLLDIPTAGPPVAVAVRSNGHIYAVSNNVVEVFDANGDPDFSFGSPGSLDGELQMTGGGGIAVDTTGKIYLADIGNSRVQIFSASGVFQSSFGMLGGADGSFDGPSGIKVDSAGKVYVAECNNHRVQVFSSTGVHQLSFGTNGSDNGQFSCAISLALDAAGKIYVSDTGNSRIQVFNANGTLADIP